VGVSQITDMRIGHSLSSLSRAFSGCLYFHLPLITKGCIFDFTKVKDHRRILVSNPILCSVCEDRILSLEREIKNKTGKDLRLFADVKSILSREWMGSLRKVNSAIYNLKRNYGYDVDRNSGFYKNPWEKFRDSIIDKSAEWIVGGIFTTLVGGLILAYFAKIFSLGH
jgi:hypothetical protein